MKRVMLMAMVVCGMPVPVFAAAVCAVQQYGAKGDGRTLDTAAIQAAIDDCVKQGGGTVKLGGAPKFVSAPIVLKTGITLEIAEGTTLEGTSDHALYPEREEFHDKGRQSLISAKGAENIAIVGGGAIDGKGDSWWPDRSESNIRPRLIVFDHCKHVRMEGVTVENSPMWQIVPYYSDDLTFKDIKVLAPTTSHNTDGIDPFSSSHVTIDHVLIDTGDDNIAIKSGQPGSPGPDAPSTDITIVDCTFLHGHGMSIGSEISGGVQRVRAERITMKGTGAGIRIKSNRDRGADIGPLTYNDIDMEDVGTAISILEFYPKVPPSINPAPVTRLTPHFHDITISNVRAKGSKEAVTIVGLPESPILGLRLIDVNIEATKGAKLEYVEVGVKDFKVRASTGENIVSGPGVTSLGK